MKKVKSKVLELKKETLIQLTSQQKSGVQGGDNTRTSTTLISGH